MPKRGLTTAEVAAARAKHGWNELPKPARLTWPRILFRQFTGLLVLILIAAAGIAWAAGEVIDAIAIGLVVILNGALGFIQEWRAERAVEALREMLTPTALVLRDGRETVIPSREIVPGDLVILDPGDGVPADLDLVRAAGLRIDESVLTGESVPADKSVGGEGNTGRAFTGTFVVAGRAEGVTTATGPATAFGRIAHMTGSVEDRQTHLQVQLGGLARQLGLAALLIAAAVAAVGVWAGRDILEMLMTGLSLAVAMVPEGLPAVVTITLALGATAMARRNALVRRLQAVETLGAASTICTDKTGTLTENQMTAVEVMAAGTPYRVTGSGYDPAGHIESDDRRVRAEHDPALAALLRTALECSHARLEHVDGRWVMTGEPTEGALVTLAYKGWAPIPDDASREMEIPFSSERKSMSVLVRDGAAHRLGTKGAPEVILKRSSHILTTDGPLPLDAAGRAALHAAYEDMAGRGLRVMAIAERDASPGDVEEEGFTFLGLVGMIDPPRAEVREAIASTHSAGISVVMITGDGPVTARAVADTLGMKIGGCITGEALDEMDDETLDRRIHEDVLFARTQPEHKMRIVESLQRQGRIVAMTGDGVNDAPALKRSDIGIAMGIRGTEVSKGAADLILLDDNFATIVRAIAEGRRQFDNIRKFVRYLLASNAGEVVAIVANLLIGGPLIFLATQILWMNLVTDSLTAIALGLEKSEADQMRRPPRRPDEAILGPGGLALIVLFGTYTACASLWLFYTFLPQGDDIARTAAFTGMIVFEKVSVFAFRSLTRPCWQIGWLSNPLLLTAFSLTLGLQVAAVYLPGLQTLLHTEPLETAHWGLIAALALPLIAVPEIAKTLTSLRRVRAGT